MDVDAIAQLFGYTQDWFRLGVVDASRVRAQYDEFQTSTDTSTEHYRHSAFLEYLATKAVVTDAELTAILNLADAGEDGCDMRRNRAMELIVRGIASESQANRICQRQEFRDAKVIQIAARKLSFRRQLESHGLTDIVFNTACELDDSSIILAILDRDDLTRDHVDWISRNGPNTATRNRATQMLRSRRFRDGG